MSHEPKIEDESSEKERRQQRRAIIVSVGILVVGLCVSLGLRWLKSTPDTVAATSPISTPLAKIRATLKSKVTPPAAHFTEVAAASGIVWRQVNGARGNKYFPEAMGTGVAWIDWDNDLDPDLIFVNSTHWPDDTEDGEVGYLAAFENDGRGNFKDVTKELGLQHSFYGTGIAVGDYNGDGFTDIYITALGKNRLFKNDGGKYFQDVTETQRVAGSKEDYSTCAGFFDVDADGDLDLLVGNYGVWNVEIHEKVKTRLPGLGLIYNEPEALEGQFGRLYLNNGDAGFQDVSEEWGINVADDSERAIGKNLGFGFGYFNEDRILDVVVANDNVRNIFLLSKETGTFDERALESGFAYDRRGKASAAMGIDVDRDVVRNEFRVVVGNFFEEMTSLYVNTEGTEEFVDESIAEGIGPRTNDRVTFGALFADFDLDGYQDIFEVNGGINEAPQGNFVEAGTLYKQPGDVFWHCRGQCKTTYLYLGRLAGDFADPIVGRGLASADVDGDGDLDLIATGVKGPAYLYRNDTESSNHWLRVKLKGRPPNTDAIGAELILTTGEHQQYRLVQPSRSYLSANELVQTFGLGKWDDAVTLKVIWPDGRAQIHTVETVDQLVIFEESVIR